MSRAINADFDQLLLYLSNYTLALPIQNTNYVAAIKKIHKRYFASLTFAAEVEQQSQGKPKSAKRHAATVAYFKESTSDLGSAMFNICHGAHKPARLMLRSALETTAKGLAASASLTVLKKKSVFNVIEDARKVPSISAGLPASYFTKLETIYADLCKDVHTASTANMAHITAMTSFPGNGTTAIDHIANTFTEVAVVTLTLQSIHFREHYHKVHFKNAPIVRAGLRTDAAVFLSGAQS